MNRMGSLRIQAGKDFVLIHKCFLYTEIAKTSANLIHCAIQFFLLFPLLHAGKQIKLYRHIPKDQFLCPNSKAPNRMTPVIVL